MATCKKPKIALNEKNAAYGKKYAGSSEVKWIQQKLKKLDYYDGKIDGFYDIFGTEDEIIILERVYMVDSGKES